MAGIRHNVVITGVDDATKQVSKNAWNDTHNIESLTEFPDPVIKDTNDGTKKLKFDLAGQTTGKTITLKSDVAIDTEVYLI